MSQTLPSEITTEFDNFISPLILISNIVYERSGLYKILELKKLYKDTIQKNPEAISNLKNIVKDCIKEVIQSLALPYRQKLKQIYTDDGLIWLIDYLIKKEVQKSLNDIGE